MAPSHFPANRGTHLRERFRFALVPQTARYLGEIRKRKTVRGTKQNSVAGLLDRDSVPGPQAREARLPLGGTLCPLVESRVVSLVRLP